MPHALDEIRKFGVEGHEVYATDTFRTAPGSHSRFVKESFITAPPAYEPKRFLADLAAIADTHRIDVIVPGFEEVFAIAKHRRTFAPATVFCSSFETLARLHDKRAFVELARSLALPVPDTLTATTTEELAVATAELPEYLARPAFSRGGVDLFTNVGPLAGHMPLEACAPTAARPWIVQRFVHGEDVCSFSVAQRGRVVAHSAYVHPKTIEHSGGILFESVDEPESLAMASRIVEHLGYHGQISFDFIRTPRGLVLVECNPRATAGVTLMDAKPLVDAVLHPSGDSMPPYVVPAGAREQIASAILRDMFRDWRQIPSDLQALLSGAKDVYIQKGDMAPGLYQALSYSHVFAFRHRLHVKRHHHSDLVAAQFYDIAWNGDALP
jgi:predicted ATP-grasp superfamily ATP-dependent carboligase